MNLNSVTPHNIERSQKRRQRLEGDALRYIRACVLDELRTVAPADWSEDELNQIERARTDESQAVLDALTLAELENELALQLHAERAVAEIRLIVQSRLPRR